MPLRLDDPTLYASEARKLAERGTRTSFDTTLELSAPLLAPHAERLAPRLAREVARAEYTFRPLVPRSAVLNGKPRTIYRIDPLDAVVLGVITRVLMAALEPGLGDHLFSYRKGRSQWGACRALLAFLHAHQKARPDPRQRGLFVLRRDVRRYDECIPVTDDSALWSTLKRRLDGDTFGVRGDFDGLVRRAFRPPIQRPDGSAQPLAVGVATGLPTQTVACNAYLLPLDEELLAIPGAFYARFGDDLLFAHPEPGAAQTARAVMERHMAALQLTFHPNKAQDYWLTAAGRAHPTERAAIPATRLAYLGFDVGFHGAQLRSDKRRALWSSLRARLHNASSLLGPSSPEERASVLCESVRTAFDLGSPLCEPYAAWLRFDVMSRADLRQLDHHLALHVAEQASGVRGVRALRAFPPRVLYTRHGLPSLVRLWDEARRRGRRTS